MSPENLGLAESKGQTTAVQRLSVAPYRCSEQQAELRTRCNHAELPLEEFELQQRKSAFDMQGCMHGFCNKCTLDCRIGALLQRVYSCLDVVSKQTPILTAARQELYPNSATSNQLITQDRSVPYQPAIRFD